MNPAQLLTGSCKMLEQLLPLATHGHYGLSPQSVAARRAENLGGAKGSVCGKDLHKAPHDTPPSCRDLSSIFKGWAFWAESNEKKLSKLTKMYLLSYIQSNTCLLHKIRKYLKITKFSAKLLYFKQSMWLLFFYLDAFFHFFFSVFPQQWSNLVIFHLLLHPFMLLSFQVNVSSVPFLKRDKILE